MDARKPFTITHGRKRYTFYHGVKSNTEVFTWEGAHLRIQIESQGNGLWAATRWQWMPDTNAWEFTGFLKKYTGAARRKVARTVPAAVARSAAAEWLSTGE